MSAWKALGGIVSMCQERIRVIILRGLMGWSFDRNKRFFSGADSGSRISPTMVGAGHKLAFN
jgi:hypothetical protein